MCKIAWFRQAWVTLRAWNVSCGQVPRTYSSQPLNSGEMRHVKPNETGSRHRDCHRRPSVQRAFGCAAVGLLGLLAPAFAGCVPSAREHLTCSDISPPDPADFSQLVALISTDPDKGCTATPCHSAQTQQQGLRLDQPSLIFEELTTRTDLIYAMVASGEMPQGGTTWDDADLRLFRSWYCNGALP